MSEDVSATMRVGITVILVAALVATVLNLMVMSNSLLSGGQTTLQSGIDSVSQQEFASYDNTKVSGTQVATALSLFQGRDVAIVIQTKAFTSNDSANNTAEAGWAFNYGALLSKDGAASTPTNKPKFYEAKVATSGDLEYYEGTTKTTTPTHGAKNFLTAQAKTVYLIHWSDGQPSDMTTGGTDDNKNYALYRPAGASNYKGILHNTNGMVDPNFDIIGTTELGNSQYLLSSARFQSVLIKDDTGSIMGIFFRQLS